MKKLLHQFAAVWREEREFWRWKHSRRYKELVFPDYDPGDWRN
jgi:hypothetical protein